MSHRWKNFSFFDKSRIIEEAKFTYSLLGKAFEKQTKIIEDQGKKQRLLSL